MNKKFKSILNYLKNNWVSFPQKSLYLTSNSGDLIVNPEEGIFVYMIHKVQNPIPVLLSIESLYFTIYQFNRKEFTEPVGYAFIPTIPDKFKIRYTPVAVVATGPESTIKAVKNAEKKLLLSTKYIEMIWLSCGVEQITDLKFRLGVLLV